MRHKIEAIGNDVEITDRDREEIEALFTNSVRAHAENVRSLRSEEDEE